VNLNSAINYLQQFYTKGIIPYPRVLNNFISKPFFQLFPHPKFTKENEVEGIFSKLIFKNNLITINNKNKNLILSIFNLLNPSEIKKTNAILNIFLDQNLNYINKNKQIDVNKKYEKLIDLLKKNYSNINDILRLEQSFYDKNYKLKKVDHLIFKSDNYIINKEKSFLPLELFSNKKKNKKKLSEILIEFKNRNKRVEIVQELGVGND